jgi:hypothetical protein
MDKYFNVTIYVGQFTIKNIQGPHIMELLSCIEDGYLSYYCVIHVGFYFHIMHVNIYWKLCPLQLKSLLGE